VRTASLRPDSESLQQNGPRTRDSLEWLDALKGIAIAAVVLDHAFIVDDYLLWKHLYFSVSWFIFLAGVSNTNSARRRGYDPAHDTFGLWRRRVRSLIPPYLFVSVLAALLFDRGHTAVGTFARDLVLFHGLPPLYFIALLLQLLALFPLLYWALYRAGRLGRSLVAITVVPVAAVLSHSVTFPWVLGAHYLFGASFLYLFVLGMLAEPFLSSQSMHPFVWLALGAIVFLPAERLNVATNGILMTHPPSNVLVAYSVGLLSIGYACSRLFARTLPARVARLLGRRSIDIYLYHYFFLIPILPFRHVAWMKAIPFVWGQVTLMLIAVPVAIGGSLIAARLAAQAGAYSLATLRWMRRCLHRIPQEDSRGTSVAEARPISSATSHTGELGRYGSLASIRLFGADRPMRRRQHR
jgi:peptidoglycan/LPS O-acetylase OafA/YrhL